MISFTYLLCPCIISWPHFLTILISLSMVFITLNNFVFFHFRSLLLNQQSYGCLVPLKFEVVTRRLREDGLFILTCHPRNQRHALHRGFRHFFSILTTLHRATTLTSALENGQIDAFGNLRIRTKVGLCYISL